MIGIDGAAPLRDAVTHDVLKRALQQMRDAVVAADLATPYRIDDCLNLLARMQRSGGNAAPMEDVLVFLVLLWRIAHAKGCGSGSYHAVVASLSAALSIKRRAVQNDDAGLVFFQDLDRVAAAIVQREDACGTLQLLVPDEIRARQIHRCRALHTHLRAFLFGVAPGAISLLVHERAIGRQVDL